MRVCALGARRKRRSWSSPEKTPFTKAITTEIEQKTVAKSEKTTERRKNAPSNSRKAVLQRRKARNTREEIRERYVTAIEVIRETGLSRSRVFALVAPCQRYEVTDAASGETRRMMRRVDVENAIYYKGYPGNPLWHSSSFQRRMIMRRWYKDDAGLSKREEKNSHTP